MILRRLLLGLLLISSPVFGAESLRLQAGPMTMVFEPDNAFLRYLQVGPHTVLQGISAPVRDQFWGTVPPSVSNLKLDQTADSFTLDFDVSCKQRDIDFQWHGKIQGTGEGRVTFTFDGEARSDFLRNRIGFCVLHAAEAAGRPCEVETVEGKKSKGSFPSLISPHQPFKDLRTISHEVATGFWATTRMEGETFEMEDQRNWTDASFKTYCTPLAIPYPVRIAQGTRISQRIEVSIAGGEKVTHPANPADAPVVIRVLSSEGATRPLAGIGLQVSSQTEELTDTEAVRLRELRLGHLRVDLTPADGEAGDALRRAAAQAAQINVPLWVGLHLGQEATKELNGLTKVLSEIQPPGTWLLIAANDEQVRVARDFLKKAGQGSRVGRGEDTNFTELNRNRPDPATIDMVSYGMNPQVHAFDNLSMIETLPIQGETVRSARQFIGQLPLIVSPITLRTQKMNQPPAADELPSRVDPRQTSLFAAGWTLGSIKYLSEAGIESATYYETVGWLGVMESKAGTPLPERFPSRPGQVFPIYHVLRELQVFAEGNVRETTSSDPMTVIGICLESGTKRRLVLANLSGIQRPVQVDGFAGRGELRRLDEMHPEPTVIPEGFKESPGIGLKVDLPPYGIVWMDSQ